MEMLRDSTAASFHRCEHPPLQASTAVSCLRNKLPPLRAATAIGKGSTGAIWGAPRRAIRIKHSQDHSAAAG